MKILVLGGTGAMGVHLVKLLAQEGHNVFVTTRSQRDSSDSVRYIKGNSHDIEFLKENLQESWDAIVDFMVYSTKEFNDRVSLLLSSTNQYVFLSSARVYANSETPITETSERLLDISKDVEYLSTEEYALTKARQENILLNSGAKNWTIIRPYITYSENRLQLGVLEKEAWLYRAIKGRTIVFSKDISSKLTSLTYGLDVSTGIVSIVGNPKALGEAFHITLNSSITWEQVLSIYLDVIQKCLGFKPKVLLNDLDKFLLIHPTKYQVNYDRLYNRSFNNDKIERLSDNSSFKPVKDGLEHCLRHFLANQKFDKINWRLEAIKDKQTKERTALKEINGYRQKISYLIHRYFK